MPRMLQRAKLWRILLLVAIPLGGWGFAASAGWAPSDLLALRAILQQNAQAHVFIAFFIYMIAYAAAVAASLPGAVIFTLLGGFLFGPLLGGAAAVAGSGMGACLLFLLARGLLKDFFEPGASGLAGRMAARFSENAFSYLLFLRLVPVFPFFLVNVVPAFCAVSLSTYAAATFIGIIPAAFAYAAIGAGLDDLLAAGPEQGLSGLASPALLAGLTGLGILALFPVIWRHWASRRTRN